MPEYSYAELAPSLGKEEADAVIRFTLANPEVLLKVKSTLSPELQKYCEVRRVEALNLFTDDEAFAEFQTLLEDFEQSHPKRGHIVPKDELAQVRLIVWNTRIYLTHQQKYGVHNAAGAYVAPAGAGWPYRLITGLFADMVQKYGDRLRLEALTPVESIDFDESTNTYTVTTPRGSIQAKTVVHATNGHAGHLLPGIRGALYPVRGQMTAQSPSELFGVQGEHRSWSIHYGTGFDYMIQSGQSGEIFLGGGLGQAYLHGLHEVGNVRDDCNSVLAMSHLSGIINATWGKDDREAGATHVLAAWTGIMGFTADGLPMVGQLTKDATLRNGSGEWMAAGFNGYGMANAWLSGKHVADQLLKNQDDGLLPTCYRYTSERLQGLRAEAGATHWMTALGLD